MSKFLKFIVHFVIICTIALILGMALPPFFGVTTVIVDSTDKATNLPIGIHNVCDTGKDRRGNSRDSDSGKEGFHDIPL